MRDLSPFYPGYPGFPEAIMPEQDIHSCFFLKKAPGQEPGYHDRSWRKQEKPGKMIMIIISAQTVVLKMEG